MPLTKLSIAPDVATYSVQDGDSVVAIKLDGGAARYRTEILRTTSLVSVQWTVDPRRFQYLRAFFNSIATQGALPFLIDLALDLTGLTEHTAHFVPNTMKHSALGGFNYLVSAQLEVTPIVPDDEFNVAFIVLSNALGLEDALIEQGVLSLERIVNVDLPAAAPG